MRVSNLKLLKAVGKNGKLESLKMESMKLKSFRFSWKIRSQIGKFFWNWKSFLQLEGASRKWKVLNNLVSFHLSYFPHYFSNFPFLLLHSPTTRIPFQLHIEVSNIKLSKFLLDEEDINMVFGRGCRKSIRNRFCGLMGTIREVEEESKYGKC